MDFGLESAINAQSRCNQTPEEVAALLLFALWGLAKWKDAAKGVWQLGKAKLFSMHALKGAQRFCVVLENICPQGISYILLSLTLRLAKLFDKPLSMLAQRPRGK